MGPVALDAARKISPDGEMVTLGLQVLTIAVVAILITAPLGSSAITILGARLLEKRGDSAVLLKSQSAALDKDNPQDIATNTSNKYGSLSKIYVY